MAWAYPHGHNVWLMILLAAAPGPILAIAVVWPTEVACCRRKSSAISLAVPCAFTGWMIASTPHGYGILWRSRWAVGRTLVSAFTLLGFGLVTSQVRR